jgi:uncharacterized protein (DUF924 family)
MTPHDVLSFWFGPTSPCAASRPEWWKKDDAFDAAIRASFGALWEAACRGERDAWRTTDEGTLALVIVLDQFSRNLCRDDPGAWEQDAYALQIASDAIDGGLDRRLGHFERSFLYMPLMHAEDRAVQERSIACFETLVALAPEALREGAAGNLRFAHMHKDIVDRFGRYPHRNAILGRESTAEEIAFLEQPGSSF